MSREAEILRELEIINRKKKEDEDNKRLQENYKKFKERKHDWIIGLGHCDVFKDNGWHHPKGYQIGSVSVDGNCGHTYYPTADLTGASSTYFHNVWDDKHRRLFQDKLNKLVYKEIIKIGKDPKVVLEIMGIQSDHYHLNSNYPKNKVAEIESEIRTERFKILDKYKLKQLVALKGQLSHGNSILGDYLKSKKKTNHPTEL